MVVIFALALLLALKFDEIVAFQRPLSESRIATRLGSKVAVVGAGFGGWGAAKSIVEAGHECVLIDAIPDPTGKSPFLTPSGKPFEPGTK